MHITTDRNTILNKAIRLDQVCELTGVSRATVWRWVNTNDAFPRPFRLSAGVTVWDEQELLDWVANRKSERGAM